MSSKDDAQQEDRREQQQPQSGIRRILVAVDSSTQNERTLQAAADLAARLQSELHAVFVENPELLRLENNPSVRQISLPQGLGGTINEGSIRRGFQAQARRLEKVLEQLADQARVEWSFRVVRGAAAPELTSAASEVDLVVVEAAGRSVVSQVRLESSTHRAVSDVNQSVLYLNEGARPIRSLVVVYDNSDQANTCIDAAMRMMAGANHPGGAMLTVVLPTEDRQKSAGWRKRAEERLRAYGVPAHFRRTSPEQLQWLVNAVEGVHGDLLIQSAESPTLKGSSASELLEQIHCPVLLVR
jgi:nucleotide-binding universal stress UspA family protein